MADFLQQLADNKSSGLPFDPPFVANPGQRVQFLLRIVAVAETPAQIAITMDAHRCPYLARRIRLA